MPIWGFGCGMVDYSICAGVGDDAGDQRYHRELAANRSGASKTCRPGAFECSIERRCAMMGRIGEPEDIANAVVFLAAPHSGWITAQVLTVDGGRMDYIGHG
jgi:NAD(P)-dependent dehydrogenase (short-subunit alcohol dehydrogenase family)